jgi:hypothetical protein
MTKAQKKRLAILEKQNREISTEVCKLRGLETRERLRPLLASISRIQIASARESGG